MASDDRLDENEELSAEFVPFALRSSFGSTSIADASAKFTLSKALGKAKLFNQNPLFLLILMKRHTKFLQVFFQIQCAFVLVSCLVDEKSVFFVVLIPQKLFLDSEFGN
ncbi:hypothetical protein PVL29_019579 [Vitis rotundifolia]|uniref:Uncharacterized protein n=1 Tax=Vitis rotundifolia TaxID=103349 RepID=A0AA39DFI3_VITRO|nr:hypothetical protein PVL29_019579 [Vitis rotundifolia]